MTDSKDWAGHYARLADITADLVAAMRVHDTEASLRLIREYDTTRAAFTADLPHIVLCVIADDTRQFPDEYQVFGPYSTMALASEVAEQMRIPVGDDRAASATYFVLPCLQTLSGWQGFAV